MQEQVEISRTSLICEASISALIGYDIIRLHHNMLFFIFSLQEGVLALSSHFHFQVVSRWRDERLVANELGPAHDSSIKEACEGGALSYLIPFAAREKA